LLHVARLDCRNGGCAAGALHIPLDDPSAHRRFKLCELVTYEVDYSGNPCGGASTTYGVLGSWPGGTWAGV
jgi:hypothetical protein